MGIYSELLRGLFEGFGHKIVMPTRVTQEMIKLGVMSSSDFMCFPFKATLGQQIWALENGATDLVTWNNCGICRAKHYPELEEITLRSLGYKFNMHIITRKTLRKALKEFAGLSVFQAMKKFRTMLSQMRTIEENYYHFPSNGQLKIGLVGEVYTMWEQDINFDIVRKLKRMGVDVDMSITLSDFWEHKVIKGKEEEKEGRKLLSQELGGHGFESICNTIWYGKNNYDGVIHLMPLSCMPESTVEILVDMVAEKYQISLYRFPIDESAFEIGFDVRLFTFVSMLMRKKRARGGLECPRSLKAD